jgi:xanthine dehydrogenase accessory factor
MNDTTISERAAADVLATALEWRGAGRAVALATVVATWGSSPRPAGSSLVIAADGAFEGSVSGGCVEGAVIAAAKEVIVSGEERLLKFGVTDDEAWAVGLACGGEIEVLVEPLT